LTDNISSAIIFFGSVPYVMARTKITWHFKRRCIPPDCVAKAQNAWSSCIFALCQTGASTLKIANLLLSEPLFLNFCYKKQEVYWLKNPKLRLCRFRYLYCKKGSQ